MEKQEFFELLNTPLGDSKFTPLDFLARASVCL